jgi:hypothetical protein
MAIPLTTITIPTPQPYSKQEDTRNTENYYYVWLQILQAAKDAGETVTLNPSTALTVDLAELVQAVKDLHFNGEEISFPLPDGPEITLKFTRRTSSLLAQ